jgi:ATP-binding cassette subfamily C protein CydC
MMLMRLTSRLMTARLPQLQAQLAQAHAALQADYADMAGPAADIAIYDLARPMARALEASASARGKAERALTRAEARIATTQTAIASISVALVAVSAQGAVPLIALSVLSAMAGLEAWAALAQHDMRKGDIEAAEQRLAAMGQIEAVEHAPLPQAAAITIAGQNVVRGARVAITGPSGVGKTRLIETLVGLRDDAPQDIRIAGLAPHRYGLNGLRPLFCMMQQDAPLIAGSVADNLSLARPGLTRDEMVLALHVACAEDVIAVLPDGLDQWLGDGGARLSGGQRRRIALARALLARRPWLVLDEPSEGLDAATESRLAERLGAWLDETGTGLILISHRQAMLALASRTISL